MQTENRSSYLGLRSATIDRTLPIDGDTGGKRVGRRRPSVRRCRQQGSAPVEERTMTPEVTARGVTVTGATAKAVAQPKLLQVDTARLQVH
jgi:hypothetical protein